MCLTPVPAPGAGTRPVLRRGLRAGLRARLLEVLTQEAGAAGWTRLCPHCGSSSHGRPVVRLSPDAPWAAPHVSVAYTDGAAVVAWTTSAAVGVDVERTGSHAGSFGDLATWTRTEALLKVTGEGLARDPRGPDGLPDLWVQPLEIGPDLTGAVALHLAPGGPSGYVEVRTEVRAAPRRPPTH